MFQMNVFAFKIAQIVERFHQNAQINVFLLGTACVPEHANDGNFVRRLLCACRKRPCGCGPGDKCDELPSLHGVPLLAETHPTTFSTDQGGGKRLPDQAADWISPVNAARTAS